MTTWDDRWSSLADFTATWSKDRSRKLGAVIVNDRQVVVGLGWNGFPRGVDDNIAARHTRPTKYLFSEHAERNALYNAAANGNATAGTRMYSSMFPCAACCRGIIQCGIVSVTAPKPDLNDKTYAEEFLATIEMFSEAGVSICYSAGEHPSRAPD